eukprot:TRINITY_DN56101_c0_g1_i1.p1 TRINITY_DN56101_c0_g1~~TRINITY_DN56101_c0_g1_i1.p1  ORF type:complete len:590 (-),score=116.58 TRINITY_DN56101_c0_g1_i1:127-1896(-)
MAVQLPTPRAPAQFRPIHALGTTATPAAGVQVSPEKRMRLSDVIRPLARPPSFVQLQVAPSQPPASHGFPLRPPSAQPPAEFGDNSMSTDGEQLPSNEPRDAERGMVVTYDGRKRGWIDNVFGPHDEIWVVDELTKKVVFSKDGDVRTFSTQDVLFTGEWCPYVETTEVLDMPSVVVKKIDDMSVWETEWGRNTGVVIYVERPLDQEHIEDYKAAVGPGPPPKVKKAVKALLDHFQQALDTTRAKEYVDLPVDVLQNFEEDWEDIWSDRTGVSVRLVREPSEGDDVVNKAMIGPGPREDVDAAFDLLKAHVQGTKEQLKEERAMGVGTAAAEVASKEGGEEDMEIVDEGDPIPHTNGTAGSGTTAHSTGEDAVFHESSAIQDQLRLLEEERRKVEEELKKARELREAAEAANAAASETLSKVRGKRDSDKTIEDWAADQSQFADLPQLKPDWIRVISSKSGSTYYVNRRTGASSGTEPRADDDDEVMPIPSSDGLNDADKTVGDWAADQSQFAHMAKLKPDWIRVKSKKGGSLYYVNTRSGETTFSEPKEENDEAPLPDGWEARTSRKTGKAYYWHAETQSTQFERPAV